MSAKKQNPLKDKGEKGQKGDSLPLEKSVELKQIQTVNMLVFRDIPEAGISGLIILWCLWFGNDSGMLLGIMSSGRLDHFTWSQLTSGGTGPQLSILSFLRALLSEVLAWALSHCCSPLLLPWPQKDLYGRCWTFSLAFALSSGLPEAKLASTKENGANLLKARNKPEGT